MLPTKENFGLNVKCSLCFIDQCTQSHILQCIMLKLKCPQILKYDVNITDASKNDLSKMKKLAEVFGSAWRKREILLHEYNQDIS